MPQSTPRQGLPVKPYVVKLPYDLAVRMEVVAKFEYLTPEDWIAQIITRELRNYDIEHLDTTLRQRKEMDKRWNSSPPTLSN